MENIGDYTGTTEDVLLRHEARYDKKGNPIIEDINSQNYPQWSDKRWAGFWHQHKKFLKEQSKKLEVEKLVEERRKLRELAQSQILQQSIRGRIAFLVSEVSRQKELGHQQALRDRVIVENLAVRKSGDEKKAMEAFRKHKDQLQAFSDEQLIYFLYVLSVIEKDKKIKPKNKQNTLEIKSVIMIIMTDRGLSLDPDIVKARFMQIPKGDINRYAKSFMYG